MTINLKMNHMKYYLFFFIVLCVVGCKDSFLEVKPSTDIVSPKTLDDFQQMLDYSAINFTSGLPLLSADEYEIPNEKDWQGLTVTERNAYRWASDLFEGQEGVEDWSYPYQSIFYANNVINGLAALAKNAGNQKEYDDILGQAYFVRAFAFFDLAKNFAVPYAKKTADTDLGVPLKLNPNSDEIVARASLQDTYDQIAADLGLATGLLKPGLTANRNRANKPAAYALGARIALSMGDYDLAGRFADSCLILYDRLIDYNTVGTSSSTPFARDNDEVLLSSTIGKNYAVSLYAGIKNTTIAQELLDLYTDNDLRKVLFFQKDDKTGLTKMKRGYAGPNRSAFSGLAVDEVYLIKAECAARKEDFADCAYFLDKLGLKRYKTGTYRPIQLTSKDAALQAVFSERRRELIWRAGLRWDDIRRLNRDGASIVLKRNIGTDRYQLEPNSPRYTFPIPAGEVTLSNIKQNNR
ncbi:RagB/SusD family nutrient uptake outer membrane protein [Sphingobacterium siyangense]|uniref:RagB/SusD family nutrient uptake outer membrane protein n=1 Tax=Sphingobacterium siyangense TaxID=459529 RepID=UPI002FDC800A